MTGEFDRAAAGSEPDATVRLDLVLCMPRTGGSIAVVRHVIDGSLRPLGVTEDCRGEIVLAVSEACSNAVNHAHSGGEYRVVVVVKQGWCAIEVIDSGIGVNGRMPAAGMPAPAVYGGRGLPIMRAVTDTLDLRATHPRGLTVGFTKKLRYRERLTGGGTP